MIHNTGQTQFVADTYRPNIFDENDRQFWIALHRYVKTCDAKIGVSNAFGLIDDIIERPDGRYGGGGFHYMFWFETVTDLQAFWIECGRLEELHYKRISGCTRNALAILAVSPP